MDSLLKFQHQTLPGSPENSKSSNAYKLVPWLNWDEWEFIRESLFSDSPQKIASALQRVSTWRSKACIPVVVDVTASIIEIQQKDPFYRKDLPVESINSEQMLAMLYCMAILRLVNCVVEKTRKKTQISIADAASAIGIPRTLIDIRHEGSHRDLPALALVRDSAVKAIDWLKCYYWEPQRKQIPFQRNGSASLRKEIKFTLRELAYCLKAKQNAHHGALLIEEKLQKKQINKSLKSIVRLYSSFSSDVLSVLLDFLLKALESSNSLDVEDINQVDQKQTFLDDWKIVIKKLSDKEPELLLMLLKAVLNLIETQNDYGTVNAQIEKLSSLFAWFVRQLEGLKTRWHKDRDGGTKVSRTGANVSDAILMEILRKCITVSSHGNKQLQDSARCLAQLSDDVSLSEKLNKVLLLGESNSIVSQENPVQLSSDDLLSRQDKAIREASRKLELIVLQRAKSKAGKTTDGSVESSRRWSAVGSWNPCPIGMLPRELGSSGRLPVLASAENNQNFEALSKHKQNWELKDCKGITDSNCELNMQEKQNVEKTIGKREATDNISSLNRTNVKKQREIGEADGRVWSWKGRLMIDGIWKNMREEEVVEIKSGVRILIEREVC